MRNDLPILFLAANQECRWSVHKSRDANVAKKNKFAENKCTYAVQRSVNTNIHKKNVFEICFVHKASPYYVFWVNNIFECDTINRLCSCHTNN